MGRKIWLIASIIAGTSYWLVMGIEPMTPVLLAWKAAGVALLALWAWTDGKPAARTIAGVMALGAVGDVVIEVNFTAGGIMFLTGHFLGLWLYWRHRSDQLPALRRGLALALLLMVPLLAWRLSGQWGPGVYAIGLGAMAASAWISRFGWSVRLGVLAFAASDLLLFASHGVVAGNIIADLLVMPLYYLGQLAICTGVVRAR